MEFLNGLNKVNDQSISEVQLFYEEQDKKFTIYICLNFNLWLIYNLNNYYYQVSIALQG